MKKRLSSLYIIFATGFMGACAPENGDRSQASHRASEFPQWELNFPEAKNKQPQTNPESAAANAVPVTVSAPQSLEALTGGNSGGDIYTSKHAGCGESPAYVMELEGHLALDFGVLKESLDSDASEEELDGMINTFFTNSSAAEIKSYQSPVKHAVNFCVDPTQSAVDGRKPILGFITDPNSWKASADGASPTPETYIPLASNSWTNADQSTVELVLSSGLVSTGVDGLPKLISILETTDGPIVPSDLTLLKEITIRLSTAPKASPPVTGMLDLYQLLLQNAPQLIAVAHAKEDHKTFLGQTFSGKVGVSATSPEGNTMLDMMAELAQNVPVINGPIGAKDIREVIVPEGVGRLNAETPEQKEAAQKKTSEKLEEKKEEPSASSAKSFSASREVDPFAGGAFGPQLAPTKKIESPGSTERSNSFSQEADPKFSVDKRNTPNRAQGSGAYHAGGGSPRESRGASEDGAATALEAAHAALTAFSVACDADGRMAHWEIDGAEFQLNEKVGESDTFRINTESLFAIDAADMPGEAKEFNGEAKELNVENGFELGGLQLTADQFESVPKVSLTTKLTQLEHSAGQFVLKVCLNAENQPVNAAVVHLSPQGTVSQVVKARVIALSSDPAKALDKAGLESYNNNKELFAKQYDPASNTMETTVHWPYLLVADIPALTIDFTPPGLRFYVQSEQQKKNGKYVFYPTFIEGKDIHERVVMGFNPGAGKVLISLEAFQMTAQDLQKFKAENLSFISLPYPDFLFYPMVKTLMKTAFPVVAELGWSDVTQTKVDFTTEEGSDENMLDALERYNIQDALSEPVSDADITLEKYKNRNDIASATQVKQACEGKTLKTVVYVPTQAHPEPGYPGQDNALKTAVHASIDEIAGPFAKALFGKVLNPLLTDLKRAYDGLSDTPRTITHALILCYTEPDDFAAYSLLSDKPITMGNVGETADLKTFLQENRAHDYRQVSHPHSKMVFGNIGTQPTLGFRLTFPGYHTIDEIDHYLELKDDVLNSIKENNSINRMGGFNVTINTEYKGALPLNTSGTIYQADIQKTFEQEIPRVDFSIVVNDKKNDVRPNLLPGTTEGYDSFASIFVVSEHNNGIRFQTLEIPGQTRALVDM